MNILPTLISAYTEVKRILKIKIYIYLFITLLKTNFGEMLSLINIYIKKHTFFLFTFLCSLNTICMCKSANYILHIKRKGDHCRKMIWAKSLGVDEADEVLTIRAALSIYRVELVKEYM